MELGTRRAPCVFNRSGLVFVVISLMAAEPCFAQSCDPHWEPAVGGQPGVDSTVRTLMVFDDGGGDGESLYVGGIFESVGGIQASGIAKWDGPAGGWSALGSGMNDYVESLAVFDDGTGPALYAGGSFTMAGGVAANHVAKWKDGSWSPLGEGINGGPSAVIVYALTVFDDGLGAGPALYAGGLFSSAGGAPANRVAKWNGSTWSPVGNCPILGVHALMSFDDGNGPALYAAGSFGVAKWNGTTWAFVGSLDSHVFALTVFDDRSGSGPELYAGGAFISASGLPAYRIAKWNGTSWSSLGTGMGPVGNPWVNCLTVFDDGQGDGPALFAGGYFETAGGKRVNRIAKWNGREWHSLQSGVSGGLDALAVFDDRTGLGPALFAGGDFHIAGSVGANRIAKWNGSTWSSLGNGASAIVHALNAVDLDSRKEVSTLFVGGEFISIGGVVANGIATWDGRSWSALGSGVNSRVHAITASDCGSSGDSSIYVGGTFSVAGAVAANGIAKWDGSLWSALGIGVAGGGVNALAMFDDGAGAGTALYAAGSFVSAGGVTVNKIAKWDGNSWSALGSGLNGNVFALTVFDDGSGTGPALYAGGQFTAAGGVIVNRIARWDGSTWSPVGTGMNNNVRAFTTSSHRGMPSLYAGGQFSTAGGEPAPGVALWDGSSWRGIGSGTGAVYSLAIFDESPALCEEPILFAGGTFVSLDGVVVNRIAKWNGRNWSPIGNGVNNQVLALSVFDDGTQNGQSLYLGGRFTVSPAGDSFLAKWKGCPEIDEVPGDINDDGLVNVVDLLSVIVAWGACTNPNSCPADIAPAPDGDNVVDVEDLLAVIGAWGECG